MKTIKDGIKLINAQRKIQDNCDNEISKIRSEIVKKFCPFKEGDIVTVTGSVHTGKKMLVPNLAHVMCSDNGVFSVYGRVLRADGAPGLQKGRHSALVRQC